ncbi:SCO family protein [Nocardioides sp. DS6]|uniref:SCO family protein n=1 Tax=Nocardioides eburneus TaxID=3231482 RepID=A0ABV3SY86_9ACTN
MTTWTTLTRRFTTVVLVTLLAAVASACGSSDASSSAAPTPLASIKQYHQIPQEPLGPATQHIAQATEGGTWSYASPAKGKLTLLYFGYTSCPDICPTTMADLAVALRTLPHAIADKIWVQFVSTDPHRDTPARLRAWIHHYSPTFHAGRAPIEQVIAAARTYGIGISKPKVTEHDYQVTHGAEVIALDRHGAMVGYFSALTGAKVYAAALPTLVKDYA